MHFGDPEGKEFFTGTLDSPWLRKRRCMVLRLQKKSAWATDRLKIKDLHWTTIFSKSTKIIAVIIWMTLSQLPFFDWRSTLPRNLDSDPSFWTLILVSATQWHASPEANISIRTITRSTILESYRKLLHAFWWVTVKGHRRPHACILSRSRWSVFEIDWHYFFKLLIDLLDNLTSNLSTFPHTTEQCEKFFQLLKSSWGKLYCLSKKSRIYVLTLSFAFRSLSWRPRCSLCLSGFVSVCHRTIVWLFFLTERIWSIICKY